MFLISQFLPVYAHLAGATYPYNGDLTDENLRIIPIGDISTRNSKIENREFKTQISKYHTCLLNSI